jgi:hypothetical protein
MRIAITRTDGGVSIMHCAQPDPAIDAGDRAAWIAHEVAKWQSHHPGAYAVHAEITAEQVPADRAFRDAWCLRDGRMDHDMPKAREIHRQRMRAARAPLLAALDVDYQRADEAGNAKAKRDIAARKQALRDVTADPRIVAAETPEALKAVWPDVLG